MTDSKPVIEGGYGWVVLGCCFTLGILITDGYATFGVFMVECTERFGYTESQLLWVGAMRMSLAGFSGIFHGGLVQKYGYRVVTLLGSMLLVTGHTLAALFPGLGLPWIIFTYGILCGIGNGCYIVVYGCGFQEYFHKRRGLANGIVTVGIAVGVFINPASLEYLFNTFGFSGAILINGAIYLNGCVLALLIIPVKDRYSNKMLQKYTTYSQNDFAVCDDDEGHDGNDDYNDNAIQQIYSEPDVNASPTYHKSLPELHKHHHHLKQNMNISYTSLNSPKPRLKIRSNHSLVMGKPLTVIGSQRSIAAGSSLMSLVLEQDKSFLARGKSPPLTPTTPISPTFAHTSNRVNSNGVYKDLKQEILDSENNLCLEESSIVSPCVHNINYKEQMETGNTCQNHQLVQNTETAKNSSSPLIYLSLFYKNISELVDFSLLKDIPFLMYCIGLAMVHVGHIAPYALLPTRAVSAGIEKGPASFLVSILGIVNGGSRLLWGLSADLSCLSHHKLMLSGISGILDGFTSVMSFMAGDYLSFVFFSCMWGIFSGGYTSLHNLLIVHLLNIENVGQGAGTIITILGFSWLGTYLVAGLLIEWFGSVVAPFYVLGSIEMAGGLIISAIPFVHKNTV